MLACQKNKKLNAPSPKPITQQNCPLSDMKGQENANNYDYPFPPIFNSQFLTHYFIYSLGFPKETLCLQAPSVYSWSERNSLLKCCAMLISHLAILTAPVERAFPTVPSCRSDLPTKDAGMNTGHKSEELNVEPESFCPSKPIILGTISVSVTFSGKPRETESHGEFLFLLQSLLGPLGALEHLKNLFLWSAWIYGVSYSSF